MKHALMSRKEETISSVSGMAKKQYAKQSKGTKDYIGRAIDAFLVGETGKFDKYFAVENALVYRTLSESRRGVNLLQDVIAVRLSCGQVLGNSSAFGLIGRTVSFGKERLNRGVTEIQTRLSTLITMIPFNVFIEAGLNLNKFKMIDRGPEETVTRKVRNPKFNSYKPVKGVSEFIDETVHFTGASLFEVDGRTFLFDIDRREIEHKIFNAFLVEIPESVLTIQDAYQALKPKAVLEAERKGLKVLRQGEWFFVPVKGDFEAVKARPNRWDKREFEPLDLQAGNNRPNKAMKYALDGKRHVVSGYVEHSGREHAKLILKGWFEAVPNTATRSFTITGDVD